MPVKARVFAFKTNLSYLLQRNLIYTEPRPAQARLDFVEHQSALPEPDTEIIIGDTRGINIQSGGVRGSETVRVGRC